MTPKAAKLPSGRWRARAYDYTDDNGKRHYVSYTAGSKAEARAAAMAHIPTVKSTNIPYPEIKLKEAYKRYIDTHKNEWSPSTVREYGRQMERDFPKLMPMKLKDITPEIVQTAINEAAASCSVKTLRNKHGLLHKVLTCMKRFISGLKPLSFFNRGNNVARTSVPFIKIMRGFFFTCTASQRFLCRRYLSLISP